MMLRRAFFRLFGIGVAAAAVPTTAAESSIFIAPRCPECGKPAGWRNGRPQDGRVPVECRCGWTGTTALRNQAQISEDADWQTWGEFVFTSNTKPLTKHELRARICEVADVVELRRRDAVSGDMLERLFTDTYGDVWSIRPGLDKGTPFTIVLVERGHPEREWVRPGWSRPAMMGGGRDVSFREREVAAKARREAAQEIRIAGVELGDDASTSWIKMLATCDLISTRYENRA